MNDFISTGKFNLLSLVMNLGILNIMFFITFQIQSEFDLRQS
jgi:hypothetical protein